MKSAVFGIVLILGGCLPGCTTPAHDEICLAFIKEGHQPNQVAVLESQVEEAAPSLMEHLPTTGQVRISCPESFALQELNKERGGEPGGFMNVQTSPPYQVKGT
ncbi:MAG: hypothetical protein ACPGQL_01275 [Thermoplasmatota archaeon]